MMFRCKFPNNCDCCPPNRLAYDELQRQLEEHQRALLKVRLALGLSRDSNDDLLQVIESLRGERR